MYDVSTRTAGGVLGTLENLETSPLNMVFYIVSKSTDLLPLSASTFPTLGGIPKLLPSSTSDRVASA